MTTDERAPASLHDEIEHLTRALAGVLAKSGNGPVPQEPLTDHSLTTMDTGMIVQNRIGTITRQPQQFWRWSLLAQLMHDLGKVADGMDRQLRTGQPWKQRHEILSLGFLPCLLAELPAEEVAWIATAVAAHHRPFTSDAFSPRRAVFAQYHPLALEEFIEGFGSIDPCAANDLADWCGRVAHARGLLAAVPPRPSPLSADTLGEQAHTLLHTLHERWADALPPSRAGEGETGVLLLGAVAMADHVASAHGELLADLSLIGFFERLKNHLRAKDKRCEPHRHQILAASTHGHVIVCTPTGSGKTETGLGWVETAITDIIGECGGRPRTFYVLPFLASINAMAMRLQSEPVGAEVGVLHSRAGQFHLNQESSSVDRTQAAQIAVDTVHASRNFRELVKITTPYQLLRAALGGPSNAATLVDTVNSAFVFDELHAYEPTRLGMILAMMSWWASHGGRIAVLSATLPSRLIQLLGEDVLTHQPVTVIDAHTPHTSGQPDPATPSSTPPRHHLRVSPRSLTDPVTLQEIRHDITTGAPVFVVANNIAQAIEVFDAVHDEALERWGDQAVMLLHSRFKGMHRAGIETWIMQRFGADRRDPLPGLCVSTQVLEVSLHISGAILHTSGAPLEPLWQRFGRINRSGYWAPCPVTVHAPTYTLRRGDEVADGVYPAEPTRRTMDLLATHHDQPLSEDTLQSWLDDIYSGQWGQEWERAIRRARRQFTDAFLDFQHPFHQNADLEKQFADMFDGVEAILTEDLPAYTDALRSAQTPAAGRLLASEYLIPLPGHQLRNTTYHRGAGVLVFDGDYDQTYGLREITERRTSTQPRYTLGELV